MFQAVFGEDTTAEVAIDFNSDLIFRIEEVDKGDVIVGEIHFAKDR